MPITLLVALALPATALAHRGSALTGYVSTVSAVQPNILGLNVAVLGGDDRLRLSNYSGKRILILGYEGEPYLRFDKQGVWANTESPAAHLNRSRLPHGLRPGVADPSAPPRWHRVARGVTYEWHDHRIHWTRRDPPPGVKEHPDRIQRIFTWHVPGRADGKRFAINGFLGYSPSRKQQDDGSLLWVIPVAAGGLVAAVAVGAGARRRRRRAPSSAG